ncbi:hypothetical protein SAV14893_079850 [Streptomyces avermitilis]|uniref:Uncharacterized protein n=1 Tax=Streptomyces avermitilis TaxID=33903 RepID=A0A4D4M9N7_STRAX|nr:hypothetical protein SAV14893_079850 [Streptomyces avermitilis]GDY71034.1 hypothetical protein SAV31267_005190 [Streptomyces avermitilis]
MKPARLEKCLKHRYPTRLLRCAAELFVALRNKVEHRYEHGLKNTSEEGVLCDGTSVEPVLCARRWAVVGTHTAHDVRLQTLLSPAFTPMARCCDPVGVRGRACRCGWVNTQMP